MGDRGISGVWVILLLVLILPVSVSADFGIQGEVLDKDSRDPVAGVTVTASSGIQVITDSRGRFSLEVTGTDTEVLEFTHTAYARYRERFIGRPGTILTIQVILNSELIYEDEVMVEAAPLPDIEPVQVISPDDVINIPGGFEDTLQALKYMPGVIGGDDFSGRLFVRGGRPDQNGIYLDGIPVYDPYRLFGLTSLFNPETLEYVKLYPGGFGVQYGDRLSAVIEVENRHGSLKRLFAGSANVSLTNANLIAEGSFGLDRPASWLISARRTYYDLVLEQMDDTDSSYPSFTDAQALLYFQLDPRTEWSLTFITSTEGTDIAADSDEDEGVDPDHVEFIDDQENILAGLNGSHLLTDNMRLSYLFSWTRSNQISDVFFKEGETTFKTTFDQNLESASSSFRPKFEWYLEDHTIISGLELMESANTVRFDISTEDPRIDIPEDLLHFSEKQDFTKTGAYLQDIWEIFPDFEIKAGLRWDHSTLSDISRTSPRLSLRWAPGNAWRVRAAWGFYYQFPSYETLQGDGYFLDLREIKDGNLKPERAIHYLVGSTYESKSGWELSLDVYYKDLDDLLESGEEEETIVILNEDDETEYYTRNTLTFVPENSREGYARGVDLTLLVHDRPGRPFYGMLTYTFGQSKSRRIGDPFMWESWDLRHSLTWVAGYKIGTHWEVSWKWRYGSGFPYTPVTNVIRVVDDLNGDGEYTPDYGETFSYQRDEPDEVIRSERYPDYHRLDIRIQYAKSFSRLDTMFYLDVINVYSRDNVQAYDYNADYSERDDIYGMPLLPSFGVKIRY